MASIEKLNLHIKKRLFVRLTRSAIWLAIAAFLGSLYSLPSLSQIVPDRTLGTENSRFVPQSFFDSIAGGAVRGENLFHSFSEFNVSEGQQVYFTNPDNINNILTRVTGNNISQILGTLGVNGNANLYFINPNGIYFGEKARLDINGSFWAGTSEGILFDNGYNFSANNPETPPLMALKITPGIQYPSNPLGDITNEGDLSVGRGQRLTLFGDRVINRGNLVAPGGTIEILGNTISLLDNAHIDVSSVTGGGNVFIGGDRQGQGNRPRAQQIELAENAAIEANSLRVGDGGEIILYADRTATIRGNLSARGGVISGNGGFIETSGKQAIELTSTPNASAINGRGGTWLIDPASVTIATTGGAIGTNLVDVANINAALNAGTGVTIIADAGDITQNAGANISKISGGNAALTLSATNNIILQGNITTSNSLDVNLIADSDRNGDGAIAIANATITILGGDINLSAREVRAANSTIQSIKTADGGGNINITARSLYLTEDGRFGILNQSTGPGGALQINASESVQLVEGAGIASFPSNLGAAGDITINTQRLQLQNSGTGKITAIVTEPFNGAIGEIGNITINASEAIAIIGNTPGAFTPNPSQSTLDALRATTVGITSLTTGATNAGNLIINTGHLTLRDGAGIIASTEEESTGNGGTIIVQADRIDLQGKAGLGTTSLGSGNAGNLRIDAADISLSDGALMSADAPGSGNAGRLNINTTRLSIRDGSRIGVATVDGLGGSIAIRASESVEISGRSADGTVASGIFANSDGAGTAGNLRIDAGFLHISDGGEVTVSSTGTGNAGNLTILTSNNLELFNQGKLSAQTASGEGGNIDLTVGRILLMRHNSSISAEAGGTGNGGNIDIRAGFIVAVPKENSDIIANAIAGRGGNINIITQGIFGLEFRNLTPESDISASSQFGVDGNVNITTLGFDPTQGLNQLSTELIDPANLVRQGCPSNRTEAREFDRQGSKFVIVGRGGIPLNPTDPLEGEVSLTEWVGGEAESALEGDEAIADSISSPAFNVCF
ncbi:filamentous hemagglutinin N-terminal domain-containing protein [Spirulina sp. 06S082]|uniref:two-partner secretion domain-containing protein n=1 Tax=Spirulina sp. 06S082 TaxID=3110248 RepID=UPI002B209803|nr:filamentous hemagglutinin N-terminal domain-containing protein [Spirulina sp. 06S082]MEA5469723.1 filamentous hemagglutinin N-terminal domain-containing protein [Spirulina sp. 06S082]